METKKKKTGRKRLDEGELKKVINVWVRQKHLPNAIIECKKIEDKYEKLK